jgi:hypothetical protein
MRIINLDIDYVNIQIEYGDLTLWGAKWVCFALLPCHSRRQSVDENEQALFH